MSKIRNFITKYALFFLVIGVIVILLWYYLAWHEKPFTQNAFIFANTRPLSMLIDGYIDKIHVKNNQFIRKNDIIFTVYRRPYELQVEYNTHELALNTELLAKSQAEIKAQTANIARVEAMLANSKYLTERANYMYAESAVPQQYAETNFRSTQALQSELEAARHTLTALKHSARAAEYAVKKSRAALHLAEVNLSFTEIRALADGYINNMTASAGGFYRSGEVICGFIDNSEWFVQANFQETELSSIRPGQTGTIWIWQYPGKKFRAVVTDTGWGVERRKGSEITGLPRVEKENEWYLLPQRFPVQLKIIDYDPAYPFHVGGSVFAMIDTPALPIQQFFWQFFLWN